MIVSWEWRIENGNFFYSQFAILKQALFILHLQWLLVENSEFILAFFPLLMRHSQEIVLHVLFRMMISWEWRIENGHFSILNSLFFILNSPFSDLHMKIVWQFFPFLIRYSQASILHTQFVMIVVWEWRIENGIFFPFSIRYSQASILHILFKMMLAWEWRIENRDFSILNSLFLSKHSSCSICDDC